MACPSDNRIQMKDLVIPGCLGKEVWIFRGVSDSTQSIKDSPEDDKPHHPGAAQCIEVRQEPHCNPPQGYVDRDKNPTGRSRPKLSYKDSYDGTGPDDRQQQISLVRF